MIKVFTDPGCNLSKDYLQAHDVGLFKYNILFNGIDYTVDTSWDAFSIDYIKEHKDSVPVFSRPPIGDWKKQVEEEFSKGNDILYVSMSQKTTGSASGLSVIGELLKPSYPDRVIKTFDTRDVAIGEGWYVIKAVDNVSSNIDEMIEFLDSLRMGELTVCYPYDVSNFRRSNRGDASGISDTDYCTIACDEDGNFGPYIFYDSRDDALEYLFLNKGCKIVCTSDCDCKDRFEGYDTCELNLFNTCCMGLNSFAIMTCK